MSKQRKTSRDTRPEVTKLLGDIRQMIEESRAAVAVTINVGLTLLYWRIGDRINREMLKGKRAEYGEEIVSTASRQLSWTQFILGRGRVNSIFGGWEAI